MRRKLIRNGSSSNLSKPILGVYVECQIEPMVRMFVGLKHDEISHWMGCRKKNKVLLQCEGLVHDRLLNLEEERIRIEKQKLLEKKRCNNIRLKNEKDRLDIERQRNVLLEKLLVAVEAVVH